MAKKQQVNNEDRVSVILMPYYRLRATMAEVALVPHEAFDYRYFRVNCRTEADWNLWQKAAFLLLDNKKVTVSFECAWNNEDGRFDSELDDKCKELYNMPFSFVRSVWASRFDGRISDRWHLIRMERIG